MLVNNKSNAKTIYVKTTSDSLRFNPKCTDHYGSVNKVVNYFNYLPFDVTVIERNGFRYLVKAVQGINDTQCDFIIRTEYNIKFSQLDEIRRFLQNLTVTNSDELLLIKNSILVKTENSFNGFTVIVENRYTRDLFKQNNKDIYCSKRDIVLSTRDIYSSSAHPFCVDSVNMVDSDVLNVEDLTSKDFGIKIELIDNDQEHTSRYVFVMGEVRKITPKQSKTKRTGVYVTTLRKNALFDSGYEVVIEYSGYNDADEKYGLYKDYESALSAGDLKELRKSELLDREHKLQMLRKQTDELNAQHKIDMEKLEHDRKLEQMSWEEKLKKLQRENDHLEHLREIEQKDRKDYYERTSQQRKDSVDIMKFLPQVIIAVGAIIIALSKFNSQK